MKELNPYYKRQTTYIMSKEDMSGNDWEYIRQYVLGGNSSAAVRIAYPMLTEKQVVNKNAALQQNKVIKEEIERFQQQINDNRELALKSIYKTIGELQLDRSYFLRDLVEMKNIAMEDRDVTAAARVDDMLIKMLGYYSPIKTENTTNVNVKFGSGGWTPDQLPKLESNNQDIIKVNPIKDLESDQIKEEE